MKIIVGYCKCGAELAIEESSYCYTNGKHVIFCPKCRWPYHFEMHEGAVVPKQTAGGKK